MTGISRLVLKRGMTFDVNQNQDLRWTKLSMFRPQFPRGVPQHFTARVFLASEMNDWKIIGFAGLMTVTVTGLLAFKFFGF
jgi:hypothetical protein